MTRVFAALRPMRTEIAAVALFAGLVILGAVGVAVRLAAMGIPAVCLDPSASDPACLSRQLDLQAYSEFAALWGGIVAYTAVALPSIAGVILGIAAVGKELDQRTTALAWSLAPSRRRWLARRAGSMALFIVALGGGSAVVIAAMLRFRTSVELPPMFEFIPILGPAPIAEGLASFGVALVVGAMLGRLLPALLAAVALAIMAFLLVTQGNERLLANETVIVDNPGMGVVLPGRWIDSVVRLPDGRIIGWNDVYPTYANPETGELLPGEVELVRLAPIELYPVVAARFLLLQLVIAAVALTLGFAVTDRRTP
ncbi:MAG TPA: hypothetical protein VFI34_08975 [Candidatus Limnocylindrales bacterium]|nr:hypothetical protein [Candidatus Limnocylindrales bacterium]